MPSNPNSREPQQTRVSFYGEDIIALVDLDPNQIYVPVPALCDRLGLNAAAQERRIRQHAILDEGRRMLPVEVDGLVTRMACLRMDLVPLWLSGLSAADADPVVRERLVQMQREAASLLWQSFKPQGFSVEDALLPPRHEQSAAEQAYVAAAAMATLARHQLLVERTLDTAELVPEGHGHPSQPPLADDPQAANLARAVRRIAQTLGERTRRNEYGGAYQGLHRQFGLSSYRRVHPSRLYEAMAWLERWHGDLLGEPEPPPDI
jgi:hypothetical protein